MKYQNSMFGRPTGWRLEALGDTKEKAERKVDSVWASYVAANPDGEDILAAVNLWSTYLQDQEWHPVLMYRSFVYGARILGLKFSRPYFMRRNKLWRARPNYCGLERQPDGCYVVANRRKWLQAVSIVRQTGRMPLSVLWNCLAEPGRTPEDPVTRDMLPPLWRRAPADAPRIRHPAGGPYIRREMEQRAKEREEAYQVRQRFGGTIEQRLEANSLEKFFNEVRLG